MLINICASVNIILGIVLFAYSYLADYTQKIKAASKHDCATECIKQAEKVGNMKSAFDKLNAPMPPHASPYGCRYSGCY